jgi:hypothetical protein
MDDSWVRDGRLASAISQELLARTCADLAFRDYVSTAKVVQCVWNERIVAFGEREWLGRSMLQCTCTQCKRISF